MFSVFLYTAKHVTVSVHILIRSILFSLAVTNSESLALQLLVSINIEIIITKTKV